MEDIINVDSNVSKSQIASEIGKSIKDIYLYSLTHEYPIYHYHIIFNFYLFQNPNGHRYLQSYERDTNCFLNKLVLALQDFILMSKLTKSDGCQFSQVPKIFDAKAVIKFLNEVSQNIDIFIEILNSPHIQKILKNLDILLSDACITLQNFFSNYITEINMGQKQRVTYNGLILSYYFETLRFIITYFPFHYYEKQLNFDRLFSYAQFIESILNINVLELPHKYNFQKFEINQTFIRIPVINFIYHEGRLYVDLQLLNGDNVSAVCLLKGMCTNEGFKIVFDNIIFSIFCRQLYVDSYAFYSYKDLFIQTFLETKYIGFENQIAFKSPDIFYYLSINPKRIQTLEQKIKNERRSMSCCEFKDIPHELNNDAQEDMRNYINQYGECVSYIVLFLFDISPPLNIFRSQIANDKIFLMIDQVPPQIDINDTTYTYCSNFQYNRSTKFIDEMVQNINLTTCFHTFLVFNYLFFLGNGDDEDFHIYQSDNGLKFKIIRSYLWMSPVHIRCKDLIFLENGKSEDISEDDCFYESMLRKLLFDESKVEFDEMEGSPLKRIICSTIGKDRFPFITIKSVKLFLQNAITQNLNLLYHDSNPKKKIIQEFIQLQDIPDFCFFIIAKVYETAKNLFISNPELNDIYKEFEGTQEFILNECKMRLKRLFKSLLFYMNNENINLMFMRPKYCYHLVGQNEFTRLFETFPETKDFSKDHPFVYELGNFIFTELIIILFKISKFANDFFSAQRFNQIQSEIENNFQNTQKQQNILFILIHNPVLFDLYSFYISDKKNFVFKSRKINGEIMFVTYQKEQIHNRTIKDADNVSKNLND